MNGNAAYREPVNPRVFLALVAGLLAMAIVFAGFAGTATAAPLSKDGKIYACYKVKGKPKGAMRIVRSSKARCKRGERKVAWSAVAANGQSGTPGQAGEAGQSGSSGSDGSGSSEVALKTEIAALSLKLEALEGVLGGITNGDLEGVLTTVDDLSGILAGVDNEDLLGAVAAVPLVETVCGQVEDLTGQSNSLLGLLDVLDALNVLSLPTALPTFAVCPTP
jgi:hypothetical protein